MVTMLGCERIPADWASPEQTLAQAVAFGFVGKIGEADGFYGDNPADGGILSPINDPRCTAPELV